MESAIALNVKRIIRQKGYKQGAIAERAGFNEKTFSNMLNGRKIIADYDIPKIMAGLNVTPNEIFGIDSSQQSA